MPFDLIGLIGAAAIWLAGEAYDAAKKPPPPPPPAPAAIEQPAASPRPVEPIRVPAEEINER